MKIDVLRELRKAWKEDRALQTKETYGGKTAYYLLEKPNLVTLYHIAPGNDRDNGRRGSWWILIDENAAYVHISCATFREFRFEYLTLRLEGRI